MVLSVIFSSWLPHIKRERAKAAVQPFTLNIGLFAMFLHKTAVGVDTHRQTTMYEAPSKV